MHYNLEQERKEMLKRNEEKEQHFERDVSRPHSNGLPGIILFQNTKAELCELR